MKLVLFVEGHAEKRFLADFFKRWLDPRLPSPVGLKVVRFEGWSQYYDKIADKVELNLSGKAGADVIAGIGLLRSVWPNLLPQEQGCSGRALCMGEGTPGRQGRSSPLPAALRRP